MWGWMEIMVTADKIDIQHNTIFLLLVITRDILRHDFGLHGLMYNITSWFSAWPFSYRTNLSGVDELMQLFTIERKSEALELEIIWPDAALMHKGKIPAQRVNWCAVFGETVYTALLQ